MSRVILLLGIFLVSAIISIAQAICYNMNYRVSLPMKDDDIIYNAKVWEIPAADDSLCFSSYLVEYTHNQNIEPSFTAYFKGNFYRCEGGTLVECHFSKDSIPFIKSKNFNGVQNSGLFAPFFPHNLSQSMEIIKGKKEFTNTLVIDTLIDGVRMNSFRSIHTIGDNVIKEISYYYTPDNMPYRYESLNNPNSIGEQVIRIDYDYKCGCTNFDTINEPLLIARYPEMFEKYRESNFPVENLCGNRLPSFKLQSAYQDKIICNNDINSVSILVFIEVGNGLNENLIAKVRKGVNNAPVPITIYWIYTNKNIDAINDEISVSDRDEYIMLGGKRLAAQCGITAFPSLLFLDAAGKVRDMQIGYNKDLDNVVIQKMESMNKR